MNNIDRAKGEAQPPNLQAEKYIRSLATKISETGSPQIAQFKITAEFKDIVEQKIMRALMNKPLG